MKRCLPGRIRRRLLHRDPTEQFNRDRGERGVPATWPRVAALLASAGHPVFTPTLTGLGERAHLLGLAVELDTFVADVAGMIESEELDDTVLVGHSFAGSVISSLAERMSRRIRHLVYLDALMAGRGERPFDQLPSEVKATRRDAAQRSSGGPSLPRARAGSLRGLRPRGIRPGSRAG